MSSQVLVFSKTSFQAARIQPHNPRAIYFNDSIAIGHVPGSDLLEITATDPDAGVVFFTLDQTETGTPAITRRSHECLQCHAIPRTLGRTWPRRPLGVSRSHAACRSSARALSSPIIATRSNSAGADGMSLARTVQHATWATVLPWMTLAPRSLLRHANVTTLTRFFDPRRHLAPHSDLVALMVLEHQVRLTNLITRVGWETKLALDYHVNRGAMLNEPIGEWSDSTRRRIQQPAEVLLRSLLLLDEAPLASPVRGTSGFAREYSAARPTRSQAAIAVRARSRPPPVPLPVQPAHLFRAIRGLPREVRDYVYGRLIEVHRRHGSQHRVRRDHR